MTASDLLRRITGALRDAGIPYMLTGSFASSLHGEPRATQDLDFVIAPTTAALRTFLGALPVSEYYVSESAVSEAVRDESMFNVIDLGSGWKIDLVIRKSRPFSLGEFSRRQREIVDGLELFVATAEDVLLAKMEWAKRGASSRQLEDAASILRVRGPKLDLAYIETWARELGLEVQWEQVRRSAQPI